MSLLTREYSPNWKDLGRILLWKDPNFRFNANVVIVELDNCLINVPPATQVYAGINSKDVTILDPKFQKALEEENCSVVIISNQYTNSKYSIDYLKYRMEQYAAMSKTPIYGFFSMLNNKFSKPHTGMWKLLKSLYEASNHHINKAIVVGNRGGTIQNPTRSSAREIFETADTDRAFAHNLGFEYMSIREFMNPELKEKFTWSNSIMSPEQRLIYMSKIEQYQNPDVITHLWQFKHFIVMVYGAPRSGKSTFVKQLVNDWNKQPNVDHVHDEEHHDLAEPEESEPAPKIDGIGGNRPANKIQPMVVFPSKVSAKLKKAMKDKLNIVIDGGCYTHMMREPFENLAQDQEYHTVYIEVNPGLGMSFLLNHVAVETATDETTTVIAQPVYFEYKGKMSRPDGALQYCPILRRTPQLMDYRY